MSAEELETICYYSNLDICGDFEYVTVKECPSCGGKHVDIKTREDFSDKSKFIVCGSKRVNLVWF